MAPSSPAFSQIITNILAAPPQPGQSTICTIFESSADALTAFAGGGQASGTLVSTNFVRFTTVATTADSGKLPPAQAGADVLIVNSGANSMNVFPATGETINAGGANAAFALAAGKTALFSCPVAGKWFALLSA